MKNAIKIQSCLLVLFVGSKNVTRENSAINRATRSEDVGSEPFSKLSLDISICKQFVPDFICIEYENLKVLREARSNRAFPRSNAAKDTDHKGFWSRRHNGESWKRMGAEAEAIRCEEVSKSQIHATMTQ